MFPRLSYLCWNNVAVSAEQTGDPRRTGPIEVWRLGWGRFGGLMATWSTAAVPQHRQFSYWREMICEAFLDLTPESPLRDGFYGRVSQQPLERLDLARIQSQAQRVRRTEVDIARSPQSGYYANLQISGVGVTTQDGRVA